MSTSVRNKKTNKKLRSSKNINAGKIKQNSAFDLNKKSISKINRTNITSINSNSINTICYKVNSSDASKLYAVNLKNSMNKFTFNCNCGEQFSPDLKRTYCKHILTVMTNIFEGFKNGIDPSDLDSIINMFSNTSISS